MPGDLMLCREDCFVQLSRSLSPMKTCHMQKQEPFATLVCFLLL